MNEQFMKTIEALEAAKDEMSELWDTLEGLEIRMAAQWHECETARSHKVKLEIMIRDIQGMLNKREKALLESVRAQQKMQPTNGGQSASDKLSQPATISG